MHGIEHRTQLPLATSGRNCCSPHSADGHTKAAAVMPAEVKAAEGNATEGVEFALEGLTCGNCVQTVEKAVTRVEGVEAASVELFAGGRSRLVVAGTPDEAAIRDAVTAAGYTLISH